jgi:F-box-like
MINIVLNFTFNGLIAGAVTSTHYCQPGQRYRKNFGQGFFFVLVMSIEQLPHRFADPLGSNRMLSSSEEALIRSSYWETNSSISRLDVQINDLLLRRRALCNYRQMLVTLLSPVRRLPSELLGEIFCYCLPQNYDEEGAHKAVMLPSHVCKHWRDVALSTPTLWTNIVLRVTDETFESQAALVTAWFSRSGDLPLSFTLEGQENVLPILAFLLQYCSRWQHINFTVPSNTLRCLEAAKGHLQRLETLRMNDVYGGTPYSVEHIFELAPRLRMASLSCQIVWNSGSWGQLTELNAGYASYTIGDCLVLLQSTRNLQKLRICIGSGVVEGHRHSVFSHPLVSLCVLGPGLETTPARGMLFDYITLPSLRDLTVGEITPEWPQFQFISFLERSSCPLQSFSFGVPEEDNVMWDDNMIQIMQYIPSLHSLCLWYDWCEVGGSSFFERLSPRIMDNGEVNCLIPKLKTISIQLNSQLFVPDYWALRKMIVSRVNISGPIERIQKVEVECTYDDFLDDGDGGERWYKEVSETLAPLQQVVETVQVFIYY